MFPTTKEIFQNKLYQQPEVLPSFQTFFSEYQKSIGDILSIKIEKNIRDYKEKPGECMSLETQKLLTHIWTRRGMDLCISQFDKENSLNFGYQPYSYPGYDAFILMILAYYTSFGTFPQMNFNYLDTSQREEDVNEYSPMKDMIKDVWMTKEVSLFFYGKDFFGYDSEGNYRIIAPYEDKEKWIGFGIQNNITTFSFLSSPIDNDSSALLKMENDLIPLYMQAIFDIHRSVANNENAVGFKKLYTMTKYMIEHEMYGKNFDPRIARDQTPMKS